MEIPLTRGFVAQVDPEDYERVAAFNWYANVRPSDGRLYAYSWMNGKRAMMHRFIMGAAQGQVLDHINRDSLDNRKANLRFATHSENSRNRKRRSDNRTGFIGVFTYHGKRGKTYRGHVTVEGRTVSTKSYPCPILAAAARDVLVQQLHGEFAALNFEFRRVA